MPRYIDAIEAEAAIKCLFPDMPRIEFNGNRRRWREENDPYLRCLDLLRSIPTADVVERKDLDEILEGHEEIGFEQGHRDGYAQAIEDAIKAVGLNTWAGSRISQLQTAQMDERREDGTH